MKQATPTRLKPECVIFFPWVKDSEKLHASPFQHLQQLQVCIDLSERSANAHLPQETERFLKASSISSAWVPSTKQIPGQFRHSGMSD